ncbi:hypothetical protein G647_07666 [Cladophialophora carrionii CBS 160.54]|uniref:Uncharacterized protein n=1 Tax=Cladophialophora carrionii CBS 160.54 TaxID=1279043 RepID=V9D363_9EURO|nr:uncharacterized protein G647_07666 [Cladophialophora carrionii CBS 160.54]ETI21320.1 hypothetical protein G647_07666 [Cladophialophora carrionii CBS 160.54]
MYWRASYQKAEAERLRLLNELTQLKQERDLPLQPLQEAQRFRVQTTSSKRRRDTSANETNNKTGSYHDLDPDLDDDDINLDFSHLKTPSTGRQAFLRGFTSLRRSLLLEKPDQEILVTAIQVTSKSISRILLEDIQATVRTGAGQKNQYVKEICTAFKTVYPTLLRGLERTQPQAPDEGDQCVRGLSDVVKVFQSFLGRLHKFALDEHARRELERTSKRNGKGSDSRSEESQERSDQPHLPKSPEDLAEAKELVRVMVRMMTALDTTKGAHCQLLKGCLCAILDHSGATLSLLVFADSDKSDKNRKTFLPLTGFLDTLEFNAQSAIGAAGVEGPFIIFILRKGIEFLLANAKCMPEKSLLNFTLLPSQGNDTGGDGDLRRKIEETLQNTLLRGVFGDDDETFSNSLQRDEEEEQEADLTKMVEVIKQREDSAEWFIGELWEHLGWNILSGRRDI